jgi:hypothetical protein
VFLLVPVFAALAAVAVLSIPGGAIDHQRARGAEPKATEKDGGPAPRMMGALIAGCTQPNPNTAAGRSDIAGQQCALSRGIPEITTRVTRFAFSALRMSQLI